ncbi:hypothetical protein CPAR01_02312 [Colletotrichum paranaense]|uniref:Uncharacterized protein n=1 Tax=Colletotrichum paranaense TaxID=1914294 RepID=A0ABQ9SZ59_9PEZI|nr:uncharacterized protein CPAR01_02312 [Colletotrichum paranaense]KAK1544810.1 hypothetical protein CPAR01_02312 [Colletotrichum paranaense]
MGTPASWNGVERPFSLGSSKLVECRQVVWYDYSVNAVATLLAGSELEESAGAKVTAAPGLRSNSVN